MSLDRRAADRRRFALVTGLADGEPSGLPVGKRERTTEMNSQHEDTQTDD